MMKASFMRLIQFLTLTLFFVMGSAQAQTEAEFQAWIGDFKQKALKQGIKPSTLDHAFADVKLNTRVLELDRRQPEFTQTFWEYFEARVTDWRIETGLKLYEKNRALLDEVTDKYGVPGRYLVAFWGMETNYGRFTGNTPIIEALATLAFDPRRSEFFSNQLMDALRILDQGHVSVKDMKGSWAGAMGQTQFMPYNYLHYAVDGDNSGTKDLWNSLPDVFHSSGHFLKKLGWKAEENWGREVILPEPFDYALADGKTMRPLSEWQKMGIKLADGRDIPSVEIEAALLLPGDYRGPVFLVYHNFFVIKRWNNSNSYALAVGHLADRLIGRDALVASKPADDKSLTKTQISEMQKHLKNLGYPAGGIDGVAGTKTRQAIRDFQTDRNIPADGFPSLHLLNKIRESTH